MIPFDTNGTPGDRGGSYGARIWDNCLAMLCAILCFFVVIGLLVHAGTGTTEESSLDWSLEAWNWRYEQKKSWFGLV